MRIEQLRVPEVTDDQAERLVGFWLSGTERLAAFMGPLRAALREFFNGVHRTGQALLASVVAASVLAGQAAPPAAPSEQEMAAQEPMKQGSVSAPPGATDRTIAGLTDSAHGRGSGPTDVDSHAHPASAAWNGWLGERIGEPVASRRQWVRSRQQRHWIFSRALGSSAARFETRAYPGEAEFVRHGFSAL
ncbi:hypothetical protein Emag_006919 [Eimeria magna]